MTQHKFHPNQKALLNAPETFLGMFGGVGCLGGEVEIYNAAKGKNERVDSIKDFTVLSENGGRLEERVAFQPIKYPKSDLYEVRTSRGLRIVCTKEHKFLTPSGYVALVDLSCGESLQVCGGVHLLTIWGTCLSVFHVGGQRFGRKLLGFLESCFAYPRRYDQQLLPALDSGLGVTPSQVDAHAHNRKHLHSDGWSHAQAHSHPYQSSCRPSMMDSYPHALVPDLNTEYRNKYKVSEQLSDLSPLSSLSLWMKSLLTQVSELYSRIRCYVSEAYLLHSRRTEKITSIKFERHDYYYDFHVPVTNNYIAQGFINHNCGKTFTACLKILELATQTPDNLCLIGRLTYPELRDSTKDVFMTWLARFYPENAYSHNKAENSVEFWNKSKVIFRHLDEPATILSMNLGAFYIDQAEEVDEDVFLTLQSRLRREKVPHYKGIITGNPKPLTWPYYKFGMDKIPEDDIASAVKRDGFHQYAKGSYRMITTPTLANQANLPADYISNLKESYSPEWFDRYVNGAWGVFDGAIFDITKVTGYSLLPEMRLIITGVDPAISKEKSACNTAICTIGLGIDGYIYDIETIAGKWSFLETLQQIKNVANRHSPRFIAVEDTAYQVALLEACQSELADHKEIIVEAAKADRDKFRRGKAVSHIVAKGLFKTNNKELLAEMAAFDADDKSSVRKDRTDSMIHALRALQKYAPIKVVAPEQVKLLSSFDYQWKKELEQFKNDQLNPLPSQINPESAWAKNLNDYY